MLPARPLYPFVLLSLLALLPAAVHAQNFWAPTNGPAGGHVLSAVRHGGTFVAGSIGGGIFISTDNGDSWHASNEGLGNLTVISLGLHPDGDIVAGTFLGQSSAYYSTNGGISWSAASTGALQPSLVRIVATRGGTFYGASSATGSSPGIFRSNDKGRNWERVALADTGVITVLADPQGGLVAATDPVPTQGPPTLIRSTDGNTWTVAATLPRAVTGLTADSSGTLWAGRGDGAILRSTDHGVRWDSVADLSIPVPVELGGMITTSDGAIFVGTNRGIIRSTDRGGSWVPVGGWPAGSLVTDFASGTGVTMSVGYVVGARVSTDRGESWNGVGDGLIASLVSGVAGGPEGRVVAADLAGIHYSSSGGAAWRLTKRVSDLAAVGFGPGGTLYAASVLSTGPSTVAIVQYSTDEGENWTVTAPPTATITALGIAPTGAIFVGGRDILGNAMRGVVRSTDTGKNWMELSSGFDGTDASSIAFNGNETIFAVAGGGLYRSTNGGESWSALAPGSAAISVATDPQANVYLICDGDVLLRSANGGDSWENLGPTPAHFNTIVGNRKGELYASADGTGVYRSTNRGGAWTQVNGGLGNLRVMSIALDSAGFLYAGTFGSGVFRSTKSTSAGVSGAAPAIAIHLEEPAPNPAFGRSTIRFDLDRGGDVTLELIDGMGRIVSTLVSGQLQPGSYARAIDPASLPGGVYLCRLRSGSAVAIRRLVVVH